MGRLKPNFSRLKIERQIRWDQRRLLAKFLGRILVPLPWIEIMSKEFDLQSSGMPRLEIGQQRIAVVPNRAPLDSSSMPLAIAAWADSLVWDPRRGTAVRLVHTLGVESDGIV